MTSGRNHIRSALTSGPSAADGAGSTRDLDDDRVRDTERAVIAAMMLGANGIAGARPILGASDFCRVSHQKVFAAVLAVHDRGERPDLIAVSHELSRRGELALVGGLAALASMMEYAVTTANTAVHARIVLEAAQKRCLRRLGMTLQQWAEDPTQAPAEVLARTRAALDRIASRVQSGEPETAGAARQANNG